MPRKSKDTRIGEPAHRKETILKHRPKPNIPRTLVEGVSDKRFRLDILELEVKLLNLNFLAAQHEALNKQCYTSDSDESSEDELTEEQEKEHSVSNSFPDSETEKLNNKFEVKDFHVAIMNPGGINSKRESILNAIHKMDIRASGQ